MSKSFDIFCCLYIVKNFEKKRWEKRVKNCFQFQFKLEQNNYKIFTNFLLKFYQ